jgi:hypothetical protein
VGRQSSAPPGSPGVEEDLKAEEEHMAKVKVKTPSVSTVTKHEAKQVERANAKDATPVVFVHGLWLLPSSWDRWVTLFEEAGYVALTPGWPDDPETVAEA